MNAASSVRATLSRSLRHLLPAALALATATCTQDSVGPSDTGVGYFTFRPTFQLAGGASLAQFGIVADSIHIQLTRPVDQLVLDTTVFFPPDSTSLRLALPVTLQQSPDTLDAVVEISAAGVVIFRDSLKVQVVDGPPNAGNIPTVVFDYVGPGTNIADIDIIPDDTTMTLGDTIFFTANALDSLEAPVTSFYVSWSTSDTTVAKINPGGRLIASNTRGTVRVVGITPTGIVDSTTLTIAPVPVIITADSGDAQTAQVGDSLPALFVARVKGADSLGIAGIPVRFVAVDSANGAAVRDTVVLTDANGRARTRGTLGTVATAYTYTATALGTGLPARSFTATATALPAAAIAIVSGDAQVDTVAQTLPLPFVVHVTDAFSNPVAGVPVVFVRVLGTGSLADDTLFTNASGNATVAYTLGGPVGTDSITATIAGTSAFVVFTAQGIAGTPTHAQEFGGGGQTTAVTTTYTDSLVVQVLDAHDNPTPGAKVVWTIFSGQGTLSLDTTVADPNGRTANALTAGTVAGQLQVDARPLPAVTGITITNTVTAGPAAAMTIAAGNGQTANAGTALPVHPTVHVADAFGNLIAGATVDFAVTAGGGTIDSASATSNAGGDANAGVWTLGAVAGGNQVRATSASIPADTLLFDATALPSGTTKLWTGASSNLFTDPNNWSPVGAPGITDNLFIPAAATSPVLGASTTIADLVIENGATLTANALLTVSGNVDIGGTLAGSGTVTVSGSGSVFRGTISNPVVNISANRTLSGDLAAASALNITSGLFTIGGRTLTVGTNLSITGSGQLVMSSVNDSVQVNGNLGVSTSTSGTGDLSAGVLVLRGNFNQSSGAATGFAPSGTHRIRFLGSVTQTVAFANPGSASSRFQDVEFGNPAGITINSTVTHMGVTTVSAGTVTGIGRTINLGGDLIATYANWQVSTTLWGQSPTVYPDSLARNVTVFNGWTLAKSFKADSNLVIQSGTGVLNLNGHKLRVGGSVTQSGVLRMQNTGDTLDVAKGFTVNSGTSGVGDLTGGMIILHGGFTQNIGANANFQPSGSHTVRFLGGSGQGASFSASGVSFSRFQNVEFADSVNFSTALYVNGTTTILAGGKAQSASAATLAGALTDPTNSGWRFATTTLPGTVTTLPDSLVTNLTLTGSWTLPQRTKITGTFSIGSGATLDLNGDTLAVTGGMTQGGILLSSLASSLLDVGGGFTVNSGTTGAGSLSDGHLVLHQGFTQNIGANANFQPSGNFLTTFAGTGGHTMSFSAPGVGASLFRGLEVFDSLTVSGSFTTTGDVMIAPAGRIVGPGTGTILAGLVDSSGLGYRMASTAIPGGQVIPAAMTTNLTLNGAWSLPAAFTLTGNLTLASGADLTVNGHRLAVSGSMVQSGILRMLQAADTVDVTGLLTVNSGTDGTGHLVDGRLLLHAGLTQNIGSFNNFRPSAAHVTEFAGSGGHALSTSSFSAANSHFQHLIVRDSLSVSGNFAAIADVTLDPTGRLVGAATGYLLGDLVDSSLAGWRMATTQLDGRFQSIPSALVSNVILNDSIALAQNTSVTGHFNLQSNGYIAFGGHGLGVSGNFTQSNVLEMNATQDSLEVGGNFVVNSGKDGTGQLSAGVLVLHGNFTQNVGNNTNFMAVAPHRTRFTGTAARTIDLTTPLQVHFGDLEIDATGAITLNTGVTALGTLKVPGSGSTLTSPAAQRLLVTRGLAVDGLTLDRVRIQLNSPSANAAQFDNVTFLHQDPTLTQLSLEFPGQAGDTVKFTNVAFDGTPTTGRYVYAADSVANDGVANIAFYNSTPLNGALYTGTEGSVGDIPNVLWTHLDWLTRPTDGTELLPLGTAPQVAVLDPSNVPVSGFSGTVTLAIANDPTGGLATLANNSVAAVSGVATFDALQVSLAGIGFTLVATNGQLGQSPPSAPFTISVPIPVGTTTAFNNGGGDNDWFNALNWSAGVPDSTDNVYVLPGQTVTVNTLARANRVEIGTGGTILLNAPLAVDSSVAAGNTIAGGGQLVAQGSGELSGQVGDLLVTGSYTVPTSETLSAQSINISGASASLDPGQAQITAIDSLRTEAGGVLNVGYPGATVNVQGLARFTGGPSSLTAGSLNLGGDFSQEENVGAFAPDSAFSTNFNSGGTQTATFFSPDSASDHFGRLQLTGGGTLHLAGMVPILGNLDLSGGTVVVDSVTFVLGDVTGSTGAFLQGNTLQVAGNLGFGGVYSMANTVYIGVGQTILPLSSGYDTLTVMGTALLGGNISANAAYVFGNGQLSMGGRRMDVAGDFGTFGNGMFGMQDPADSLMVAGSFYATGGATTGLLTAGVLQVGGSFFQGNYVPCCLEVIVAGPPPAGNSFDADPGMKVRLTGGSGNRLVFFANPVQPPGSNSIVSGGTSKFGDVEFVDGVDTLLTVIPVAGTATMAGGELSGGTLGAVGKFTVLPGIAALNLESLYSGGGIDYQASASTFNVPETFFFGGDSIPVLPYQWLRVGFVPMALTGDVTAGQVTVGGQGEGAPDSYGGVLIMNGHTLATSGDVTLTGFGLLAMVHPADSLDVGGRFDFQGGPQLGLLTDGVIFARGDVALDQNFTDTGFVATGNHRFVMAAPGNAQLSVGGGSSAVIRLNRYFVAAGTTVNFDPFTTNPLVVNDTFWVNGFFNQVAPGRKIIVHGDLYAGVAAGITVDTTELYHDLEIDASGYSVLWTRYAGTGQIIVPGINYQAVEVTGTASLADTVTVAGNFLVSDGGTFDLAGHRLTAGAATIWKDGLLVMNAPGDTLTVADGLLFDGRDTEGWLTDGVIQTNYFKQQATTSDRSFRSSGNHRVIMTGIDPLDSGNFIDMATGGSAQSRFNKLILDSGGSPNAQTNIFGHVEVQDSMVIGPGSTYSLNSGLELSSVIHAVGAFVVPVTVQVFVDTLDLSGPIDVATGVFNGNVVRFSGTGQAIPDTQSYNRIEITGTAAPEGLENITANEVSIYGNGRLTIGAGQRVLVGSDFFTSENGTLEMNGVGADLVISNNATFAGGSSSGLLTNGNIHIAGNFTSAINPGGSWPTFETTNTGVEFNGGSFQQSVTLQDGANALFRAVGITNPNGIMISGLMIVTDSVGTAGPVEGDSLYQFGSFFMNSGAQVTVHTLKTAGLFVGSPESYNVRRTHIVNPNALPSVSFDTLVINSLGVSAFAPINASVLYVAANGSAFSTVGGQASLDLGIYGSPVTHFINGDLHVEGAGALLEVAEDTVNVSGDLYTSLGGTVGMNGPGAIIVSGSTLFGGGSEEGLMTSGTLQVFGGITQQAFSSPSSFRMDGTVLDLPAGPSHVLNFETADSSFLPDISQGAAGGLNLIIVGRVRVAGGISGNAVTISGDTLIAADPISGSPSGISVTLGKYEGPVMDQFQNVTTWSVGTTHFTGGGGLPYNSDFAFDTLIVSGPVNGELSQLLTANYVEVTGPGNPRHIGASPGVLSLDGGDGNTYLKVSGNVVVSGAGAAIVSNEGRMDVAGDLSIVNDGYLYSNGGFGGAEWNVDGNVLFDGTITKDSLVQGHLKIGGNFTQKGTSSGSSFAPDSTFVTEFVGAGPHDVSFETPGDASVAGHSYFGSLATGSEAMTITMNGDYYVEGTLMTDPSGWGTVFFNTGSGLGRLNAQDVNLHNVTFDHLQFRVQKHSAAAAGAGIIDIVKFQNFQADEDQFVVILPGQAAGGFSWSNFTFSQLDLGGTDTGHYVVATDWDGSFPFLGLSIGTNQATSNELLNYYVGLNGATVSAFAP